MTNWKTKKLGDVCQIIGGGTPSRQKPEFFGGPINWATPTDITALDGLYISASKEGITEAGLNSSSAKLLPTKAVLMTSRATIGFTAVTTKEFCTNQGFANFICSNEIYPEYLAYWLPTQRQKLIQLAGGTTFKEISKSTLKSYKIPYPPIAEQKRIVEILKRAEGIIRLRKDQLAKTRALIPALFIDMFGDPAINPKSYKQCTIIDVCSKITDGTHHSPPSQNAGIPYITAKHLSANGLDFFNNPTYVSEEDHKSIYSRCNPEQGDVLYIKDGATTGIAAINEYDFPFSMLSSLALLKPDANEVTAEYLCEFLNFPTIKRKMISNMGGAAIQRLTLKKIKESAIVVPPVLEQQKFSLKYQGIISTIKQTQKALEKQEALFQSLLHHAFQGTLTADAMREQAA